MKKIGQKELTEKIEKKLAEIAKLMKQYDGTCNWLSLTVSIKDNYCDLFSEKNKEEIREIEHNTFELLK